jgi:phage terminase large subunit GpA-like protein
MTTDVQSLPGASDLSEVSGDFQFMEPPFRGEIWELCASAPMGKGHNNSGQPFDIRTAHYLREPLMAMRDVSVRKVVCKAGVKTLKTFAAEMAGAYQIVNGHGDVALYMADEEMAKDHAKGRLNDYWAAIPAIAKMTAGISSRHDDTTTELYFPGKTVRIWPANYSATQNINLETAIICDGHCIGNTGLIEQIIQRTSQYPHTCKVIIESQGSAHRDDFDRQYEDTDKRMLHIRCPFCGSSQPFLWRHERAPDFEPVVPLAIPSLDRAAWKEHWRPILRSADRQFAGMQRGDSDVKLPNGEYDESRIVRGTFYECLHCASRIDDDGEFGANRIAIDQSAHYVPTRYNAVIGNVGFNWPKFINRRVPWGGRMLDYLKAKQEDIRYGRKELLKQWVQKDEARTWSPSEGRAVIQIATGDYEVPDGAIPDEVCRAAGVDCQQDPGLTAATGKSTIGHFWMVIRAIDKRGDTLQLHRGYHYAWDSWIETAKKLQVRNDMIGIDGGQWLHDVLDMAAKKILPYKVRVKHRGAWREETHWKVWTILCGDDTYSYKWPDGRMRYVSPGKVYTREIEVKGQRAAVQIYVHRWSNLGVKDMLMALVAGGDGRAKFKWLAHSQLSPEDQLKESGDLTYERQMDAEWRTQKKNGEPIWEKQRPDNHFNDCECECLVIFDLTGCMGGVPAAPVEDIKGD